MKALHLPTNKVYEASALRDDDALRDGPWRCPAVGCDEDLFYKKAFHRRTPSGGRTVVSATFSCLKGRTHNANVKHERLPPSRKGTVDGDASRRNVHRLRGLPTTPATRMPTAPMGGGSDRTVYEYGDELSGLQGLIEFVRRCKAEPEFGRTEKIRYDGVDYFHNELAYDTTRLDFQRLARNIRSQVNRGERAYLVQGIAKYGAYKTRTDEQQIHLVTDHEPDAPELHVFMPDTEEFRAVSQAVRKGHRVTICSVWSFVLPKVDGVALRLVAGSQILLDTDSRSR